ncbi:hypothetical protein H696_04935 [Fonticula alba]|uniref:Uncharacterized protein n=1 Tax=Fonticula alba TaxID=691883 RepID=A0A058Z2X7_FONAL|nr:hypothetical protein H696_04935 [Fonticula alba]KCV68644.1 hypothetical protein H696_04935 [Fonticula alba]|eukprot:XP_009497076.1 hypothetical protein H696_04935 [Fonticula alba]
MLPSRFLHGAPPVFSHLRVLSPSLLAAQASRSDLHFGHEKSSYPRAYLPGRELTFANCMVQFSKQIQRDMSPIMSQAQLQHARFTSRNSLEPISANSSLGLAVLPDAETSGLPTGQVPAIRPSTPLSVFRSRPPGDENPFSPLSQLSIFLAQPVDATAQIAESIQLSTSLQDLYITANARPFHSNTFRGAPCFSMKFSNQEKIFQSIADHADTLRHLRLSGFAFDSHFLCKILPSLNLTSLSLNDCLIQDNDFTDIMIALSSQKGLEHLSISGFESETERSAHHFASFLQQVPVTHLTLRRNVRQSEYLAEAIAEVIANRGCLARSITLEYCRLTTRCAQTLLSALERVQSLPTSRSELPRGIYSELRSLNLSHNPEIDAQALVKSLTNLYTQSLFLDSLDLRESQAMHSADYLHIRNLPILINKSTPPPPVRFLFHFSASNNHQRLMNKEHSFVPENTQDIWRNSFLSRSSHMPLQERTISGNPLTSRLNTVIDHLRFMQVGGEMTFRTLRQDPILIPPPEEDDSSSSLSSLEQFYSTRGPYARPFAGAFAREMMLASRVGTELDLFDRETHTPLLSGGLIIDQCRSFGLDPGLAWAVAMLEAPLRGLRVVADDNPAVVPEGDFPQLEARLNGAVRAADEVLASYRLRQSLLNEDNAADLSRWSLFGISLDDILFALAGPSLEQAALVTSLAAGPPAPGAGQSSVAVRVTRAQFNRLQAAIDQQVVLLLERHTGDLIAEHQRLAAQPNGRLQPTFGHLAERIASLNRAAAVITPTAPTPGPAIRSLCRQYVDLMMAGANLTRAGGDLRVLSPRALRRVMENSYISRPEWLEPLPHIDISASDRKNPLPEGGSRHLYAGMEPHSFGALEAATSRGWTGSSLFMMSPMDVFASSHLSFASATRLSLVAAVAAADARLLSSWLWPSRRHTSQNTPWSKGSPMVMDISAPGGPNARFLTSQLTATASQHPLRFDVRIPPPVGELAKRLERLRHVPRPTTDSLINWSFSRTDAFLQGVTSMGNVANSAGIFNGVGLLGLAHANRQNQLLDDSGHDQGAFAGFLTANPDAFRRFASTREASAALERDFSASPLLTRTADVEDPLWSALNQAPQDNAWAGLMRNDNQRVLLLEPAARCLRPPFTAFMLADRRLDPRASGALLPSLETLALRRRISPAAEAALAAARVTPGPIGIDSRRKETLLTLEPVTRRFGSTYELLATYADATVTVLPGTPVRFQPSVASVGSVIYGSDFLVRLAQQALAADISIGLTPAWFGNGTFDPMRSVAELSAMLVSKGNAIPVIPASEPTSLPEDQE